MKTLGSIFFTGCFTGLLLTASGPAAAGGDSVMPPDEQEASLYEELERARLDFAPVRKRPEAPTVEITQALVREIQRGAQFCSQLPRTEYSLDCLSDRMAFTARLVPRIRDYAALKSVLDDAATQIRQLARQNRSRNLPTGSVRLTSGRTRPLVPFDTAKREVISVRAADIVSDASSRMFSVAARFTAIRSDYEAFATAIQSYLIFTTSASPNQG